jgi:hypothetical protein
MQMLDYPSFLNVSLCFKMVFSFLHSLSSFQFAICFYKSGDFAKFEELTRALFPVIVRNVKEEEDASVVCSCLESVVS